MNKYLIGAALSLGILVSPALVYATSPLPTYGNGLTFSQVEAILSLLNSFGANSATIAQVNSALTGVPTTAEPSCYYFKNNLGIGSSGADVSALNRALTVAGVNTSGNSSYFDENTAADVVSYQAQNGIRQTGVVGPLTRAQLNRCSQPTLPQQPRPTTFSVDLKINGSDGPMTLIDNQRITASWTSSGTSCYLTNVRPTHGAPNQSIENLPGNGSRDVYAALSDGNNGVIAVQCRDGNSTSVSYNSGSDEVRTSLSSSPETASIRVMSPNGGEQWEIGQLNTVTWTPYGYNPDVNPAKDVNVFLERLDGSTAGQVMDTGKASLHTYFNIGGYGNWAEPGQYRVYVANRLTGANDRSDAPFTLLPRGIDIRVNGSDGPVTLTDNQPITVTFKAGATFQSCMLNGVRENVNGGPGVEFGNKYPIGSTFNGYAYAPTPGSSTAIYITCTKADGSTRGDSVQVNMGGTTASLKITSPNGGEQIVIGQPRMIQFNATGVKSASIALYANDKWLKWIQKDIFFRDNDGLQQQWIPSGVEQEAAALGSVFKIYITGQKSDGSGYVDDKSDAPFGFIVNSTSCVAPKIAGNILVATESSPNQQWGQNLSADQAVTWSSPNLPPWGVMSGNQINFTAPPYTGTYSYTLVATNGCGGKDSKTMTIYITNGSAVLDQSSMTSDSGTPTISGTSPNVGAVGVVISNSGGKMYGSGLVGNNGGRWSVNVSPPLPSGTYTVSVYNYFSNVLLTTGSLVVKELVSAPTLTLTASPTTITAGQSATLSWSSANTYYCSDEGGKQSTSGYMSTDVLYSTRTFTVTCSGAGGSVTKSVTVNVQPAPVTASSATVDMKVNGSDGPIMLSDNQSILVSLSTKNINSMSCTISGVRGAPGIASSPSQIPMMGDYNQYSFYAYVPSYSTSIVVQCTGTDGSSQSDSVYVTSSQNQSASALNAFSNAASVPAINPQPKFSYVWNNDLQIGSLLYEDTKALQIALAKNGVYAGEVTGGFYNQTYSAVQAFQQKYGIEATGFVGPVTREKLNSLYSK